MFVDNILHSNSFAITFEIGISLHCKVSVLYCRLDDWEAKQPEWQRTRLVLDNAKERLSKGDPLYSHLQLNGSSGYLTPF